MSSLIKTEARKVEVTNGKVKATIELTDGNGFIMEINNLDVFRVRWVDDRIAISTWKRRTND